MEWQANFIIENRKLALFIENMNYESIDEFGYDVVLGFKQNAFKQTGFENIGYFCRRFKKLYGVTPINYRKYYRSAERNSMRNIHSDTNVLSG